MIIDTIHNAQLYYPLGERIQKALTFVQKLDSNLLSPGKHEILGEDLFYFYSEYSTKEEKEARFEAHNKYIDLFFIVDGTEQIRVADRAKATIETELNDSDALFLSAATSNKLRLNKDDFIILFPNDAHMPGFNSPSGNSVKKIVVKIKI